VLFIEDLASLVLWLVATVLSVNLLFLMFIFYRRLKRKRYYEDKDSARSRYTRVVSEFVDNEIDADRAITLLEDATSKAEQDAVQEMLLAQEDNNNAERISQVLFGLGYVERWSRKVFGRGRTKALVARSMKRENAAISTRVDRSLLTPFIRMRMFCVPRAVALESLGRLAPQYAQVFIAEALHDPAPEVRRVAIAAMGRNRHPAAIPLLFGELLKAVEMSTSTAGTRPRLSIRGMRRCEMTALSTLASCSRICFCWCGGNTAMMRLIVSVASSVWSVENTRWPVSAASSAVWIVSWSRISPTRMTSGS